MLPARLERLEASARFTAREINERRELLDWHLNAQKELAAHKAGMAAQQEAEARVASAVSEGRVATSQAPGSVQGGRQSAGGLSGTGLLRSSSASRMGAEAFANSAILLIGSKSTLAKAAQASASTPMLKSSSSIFGTTQAPPKSMHARADLLVLAAERNARELADRRPTLDAFKEVKRAMEATKKAKNGGKSSFNYADPLPPGTFMRTTGCVQNLSYNSRCNFAQNYSLQPLHQAVMEVPPPHPVHPTSSMQSRLEACEHRVLWNHQTMTHNQKFLDDYGRFASGDG